MPGSAGNLAYFAIFCYKTALVFAIWSSNMSRVCQVTGKRPQTGNNRSHARNQTKRRFLPNLQRRRYWVEEEKRFVWLRLSSRAIRIIDKLGIKTVLDRLKAKGEKI